MDRANEGLLETERKRAEAARGKPRDIELLPKLRVHHLRHTFVSMMAAQGVRLEVIAQWIGDNPATVMKISLHVFKQDMAMPTLGLLGPASEETTGDAEKPDQSGAGEQPDAAD